MTRAKVLEIRKKKEMSKLIKEIDEIIAVSSQIPADEAEISRLRLRVATLEVNQKEQDRLFEKMNDLVYNIPGEKIGIDSYDEKLINDRITKLQIWTNFFCKKFNL